MVQHFPQPYRLLALFLFLVACVPQSAPPPIPYTAMGAPRIAERRPEPMAAPRVPEVSIAPTNSISAPGNGKLIQSAREVKIGLLLPLTGPDAALGQAMLDAATLALFDKEAQLSPSEQATKVTLLPRDSADGAQAAADVIADGATIILGPVYGETAEQAASPAREKNIPLLTFSNSRQAAGRGVWLLGFLPDEQARRIADFLYTHRFQRVAALLSGDPYGSTIAQELDDAASRTKAPAPWTAFFTDEGASLDGALDRLAAKANAAPLGKEPDLRPQALLIGAGGETLARIAPKLVAKKIDPKRIRLVGTGLWDDPRLTESAILQGGWFVSANPAPVQTFEQRFAKQFGNIPPKLAGLAYDATALAASLAHSPDGISTRSLTAPGGFTGPVNGLFRLLPDGTNQRGLAILEVAPKGFRIVDPAPARF